MTEEIQNKEAEKPDENNASSAADDMQHARKSRLKYAVLASFFGCIGLHNCYAGRRKPAVIQGITGNFIATPAFLFWMCIALFLPLISSVIMLEDIFLLPGMNRQDVPDMPDVEDIVATAKCGLIFWGVLPCLWSSFETLAVKKDGAGREMTGFTGEFFILPVLAAFPILAVILFGLYCDTLIYGIQELLC